MSGEQIERDEYCSIVFIQSKLEFSYSAFIKKHCNTTGNIYTVVIDMQCASSALYVLTPVLSIGNNN